MVTQEIMNVAATMGRQNYKKTKFTLAYFIWNSQDAHFSFKHSGNEFKNLMKFDISK